jgi:ribose transport system substrate-binding protein
MPTSRRQFITRMVAASSIPWLSSCRQAGPSGQGNSNGTIAVLFDGLYSPFWVAGHDAIIADLKKRKFEVAEAISEQDDAKQLTQLRALIARGVQGVIIVHTDSNAVVPAIRAANKAHVPMVHFNRAPASSDAFSVAVQADNLHIATATVEHMVQAAKQRGGTYKGAILIGDLGDGNAIARRDGFFAVVDQHPDLIKVVSRIPTDWNTDTAYAGLTNAFQSHPDINFLFSSADFLFPQIVEVMKKANKFHPIEHPDHVVFGGFDGDKMAYELLHDQYLDADGVQDLEYEAKLCVDSLVDMAAGRLGPQKGQTNPLILNDPGFTIHQGNLQEMKERMWGYQLHLRQSPPQSTEPGA